MQGKPWRKRIKNLFWSMLLLLVSLALCLLAAEWAVRRLWQGYNPVESYGTDFLTCDSTLGWKAKVAYACDFSYFGEDINYRSNSLGFRDVEPDTLSVKRRLMLLGDSYTMGNGIAYGSRASEQLEQMDSSLTVFNFGITGYDTVQELLILKAYGHRVLPDDVVLFFCANDRIFNAEEFMGGKVPKPYGTVREDGSLELGNVPVPQLAKGGIREWLVERLALAQMAQQTLARVDYEKTRANLNRAEPERPRRRQSRDRTDTAAQMRVAADKEVTYVLLREMRDECNRQGARFWVFLVASNRDWTENAKGTPPDIQPVMDWCADLDVPCADLFPVFQRHFAQHRKSLYVQDDMHWNVLGNQIVAQAVLETMKNSQLSAAPANP